MKYSIGQQIGDLEVCSFDSGTYYLKSWIGINTTIYEFYHMSELQIDLFIEINDRIDRRKSIGEHFTSMADHSFYDMQLHLLNEKAKSELELQARELLQNCKIKIIR